jgi:O-antigen/teichoic acid export membrane protein
VSDEQHDILRTSEAGPRVIRGTAVRVAVYGTGVLLLAATSILLLRYLGVEDFGRWVTVTAMVAIVGGITELGLGMIGTRELAVRPPGEERRRLLGNLLGLRLLITPLGVLVAVGFSLVAGYDDTMVAGTALAGVGIVLVTVQVTALLPLSVELKNARIGASDLIKQATTALGVLICVVAGASLLPFFAVPIAAGLAGLAAVPLLVPRSRLARPRIDRGQARMLFREALPVAAAFALGILYFRILIVMMSLLTTETETGLFGTSFRILEIVINIPTMIAGIALPVLAAAVAQSEQRSAYAVQRLTEAALLVAVFLVLGIAALAEPVILVLGGDEYRDAIPVLRIQAFALLGIFLSQVWSTMLVALRRQRDIVVVNGIALAAMLAFGLVLIPPYDATGAAIATVAGDALLAVLTLVMLGRANSAVRPRLRFVWRVLAAGGVAALTLALLPVLGAVPVAVIATGVFAAGARLLGVVPQEIFEALRAPLEKRPSAPA